MTTSIQLDGAQLTTDPPKPDLALDADVLLLARRGFFLFPCWGTRPSGICECRAGSRCPSPGKHPRTRNGHRSASSDLRQVSIWRTKYPSANWAVACGPSGLGIVDVDPRAGGDENIYRLEQANQALPDTWRTLTGGGGFHAWFRRGDLTAQDRLLAPGVDWKAGGYVIVAGSRHMSGRTYEWEVGYSPVDLSIQTVPAWLRDMLSARVGSGRLEIPEHLQDFDPKRCPPLDKRRLASLLEPGNRFFSIWHRQGRYSKYHGAGASELDMAMCWELQRAGYDLWNATPVIAEARRTWGESESKAQRRDYLLRTWVAVEKALKERRSGPAAPLLAFQRVEALAQLTELLPSIRSSGADAMCLLALQILTTFMNESRQCFMSIRKLGETISVSPQRASKIFQRLQDLGLIELIQGPTQSRARTWLIKFTEPNND